MYRLVRVDYEDWQFPFHTIGIYDSYEKAEAAKKLHESESSDEYRIIYE